MTEDTAGNLIACSAESTGGVSDQSVTIKRDATAPLIGIASPSAQSYLPGQTVLLSFTCSDETSHVATCTANQSGTLNTSSPGTFTFTVTAVDQAGLTSTSSVTYTVERIAPLITWPTPAPIVVGDALSGTQLNATASVPGTFTYSPVSGTVLPQGWSTLSTTFTPADTTTYAPATKTATILVKGVPMLTWANPSPQTYYHSLNGLQLNATANVPGTFVYSPPFGTILDAGVQTLSVTFTPTSGMYTTATTTATFEILKGSTTIDWSHFDNITYGTALSAAQLHAQHNALDNGSIVYTPPAGTILNAGTHTLSATFVPQNPNNYDPVTVTRSITVFQAYPPIFWSNPASIPYGTPLSATQLNASSTLPGTFSYNPPLGTVLNAGSRTLTATFTPDSPNYQVYTAQKTLTVTPLTTVLTWSNPAAIVYGTPLGASQLNATANVPGTFSYTPASGTVLEAGNRSLYVYFTPSDAVNYTTASKYVAIVVQKRTPVITWSNPAPISYGTALSWTQYNATISGGGSGSFNLSPPQGTVLQPGPGQPLTVTWQPQDYLNYNSASATVTIDVALATPAVTWSTPGTITYGAALSGTQLNASSPVPGTFAYAQPAGTVLPAGSNTLSVTFTPADPAHYATVTATVTLNVAKATPVITWPSPASVTYPTALSEVQLNATATVPGTFGYSQPVGTTLNAGSQVLTVTFTPSDTANYNSPSSSVTLYVAKGLPVIDWPVPSSISFGTALGPLQLNASTTVTGSFAYSPDAGTVLGAGSRQLWATFTSADPNYNNNTKMVNLTVAKAVPTVTWDTPAAIAYGTALSATQLNATASVPGSFAYSPAAGTVLNAGGPTLTATFTPADTANYANVTRFVTQTVTQVPAVLTWTVPSAITYGTSLTATQLNASANVGGSFAYSPAAGTVLNAGSQTLSVTFTTSHPNYSSTSTSVPLQVNQAATTISWSAPAGITYGTALSATQLTASGSVAGTLVYSPAAGTILGAGTHTLSVTLTPANSNYAPSTTTRSITVAKKALTVTTVNSTKVYGQALPAFGISGTGFVNGDTVASLGGTVSFSTSATATSAPGTYNVTPSGATSSNYTIAFAAGTLTISKADTTTTLTANPSPSLKNQTVTLTATVAPVAPGAGMPTGTITFRDNGTSIGTATLVNGVATLNKSFTTRGSHPLTATFTATTNFNGSVGSKTQQVN